MTMRFADVALGDDLPEMHPDVSLERVKLFLGAAGMSWGRFTDDEQARKEGLPGAIVPGIMSQGLLATMVHQWAPGCRIRKIDTVFRSPTLVGSRPTFAGAVTDVDADANTVELDLTISDEAGDTTVLGTAVVELD